MKKLLCGLVAAALLSAVSSDTQAQSCAITNHCDFCVASQGISPIEMGRSGVRYDLRYLDLSHGYSNGVSTATSESESHLTNQITLMYYVSPKLSLSLVVPYVYRQSTEAPEADVALGASTLTNRGIGDVIALGRYRLYSTTTGGTTRLLAATAGLRIPTGSINKQDASGELADAHMQLGAGTWDPVTGLSALYGEGDWALAANALVDLPLAANTAGHEFGKNLNYDATLRYKALDIDGDEDALFVTGGIAGEWRGMEQMNGEPDLNSGGNVIFATPGAQIFFSDYTSIEASYQIPILHALNGDQLGETYRIEASLQYLF